MTDIERLYVSSIDSKPINVEGWGGSGEDGMGLPGEDRWDFWQNFNTEVGDHDVTLLTSGGSSVTAVLVDGERYTDWDDYEERFYTECAVCLGDGKAGDASYDECPTCEGTGFVPVNDKVLTEGEFETAMGVEPYQWGAEGPMMNYWYPVDHISDDDEAAAAAAKLDGVSLCVVRVDNSYGLALTGGGMDFSWDICRAFIQVGALPPTHFSDLPRMGKYDYVPEVVAAMRRSLTIQKEWADRALERLNDLDEEYGQ